MIHRFTKFLIILIVGIPSILFSITIIGYFMINRGARSQLRNHGWLVLICVFLAQVTTDFPMAMSYYYYNQIRPESYAYCVWWTWYEFSFNGIGLFLMASISVERHILIFYSQEMLQTPWRKWLFHFCPIILSVAWPCFFYILVVVISPFCSTEWTFQEFNCGVPCYFMVYFVGQFDFLFNIVTPLAVIILANILLIIRVVYHRTSHHQPVTWRRHRKMTIQLGTVSSVYLAFWLPITIVQMIQITVLPSFMLDQVETLLFLIYFVPLLSPMVCMTTLPDLLKRIVRLIRRHDSQVVPIRAAGNHSKPGPSIRTRTITSKVN